LRVPVRVQNVFATRVLFLILKMVSLFSKLVFVFWKRKYLSKVAYLDKEIIIGRNNLLRTRIMREEMLC
jgi:hypothetical protein